MKTEKEKISYRETATGCRETAAENTGHHDNKIIKKEEKRDLNGGE